MSEQWSRVRITVIDVNGSNDLVVESIRAATSGDVVRVRDLRELSQSNPPTIQTNAQEPEQAATEAKQLTAQSMSPREPLKEKKKSTVKRKGDNVNSQLRASRKAKLDEIVKAKTFDDHERYSAAIGKDGAGTLDLAALATRLAQEKFGFDEGLSPFEVRSILKNRFYINVGDRTMEETMKKAPSTFFAVSPADFDQRSKLYRPMKECLKRVDELLTEFNEVRLAPGGENRAKAAAG